MVFLMEFYFCYETLLINNDILICDETLLTMATTL